MLRGMSWQALGALALAALVGAVISQVVGRLFARASESRDEAKQRDRRRAAAHDERRDVALAELERALSEPLFAITRLKIRLQYYEPSEPGDISKPYIWWMEMRDSFDGTLELWQRSKYLFDSAPSSELNAMLEQAAVSWAGLDARLRVRLPPLEQLRSGNAPLPQPIDVPNTVTWLNLLQQLLQVTQDTARRELAA
jgi:hypothetical protein